MPRDRRLLLTCEHAECRVPRDCADLFRGAAETLRSHRGWDPGSLPLARALQARLGPETPLFRTRCTRLLVEPNRSLGHARLFSEFTRPLSGESRQDLLERYYFPHRNRVEAWIRQRVEERAEVVHLSIHTFTPELDGQIRRADIGLLYDPRRTGEKEFCDRWDAALGGLRPDLRIRRNYPYQGRADGFTTFLRRQFPPTRYAGIELEVNQSWVRRARRWSLLKRDLAESLALAAGRH